MKINLIWRTHPLKAWLISAVFSTLITLILVAGAPENSQTRFMAAYLIIIAGVLVIAFLTRLPSGKWYQRIFKELLWLGGSAVIFVVNNYGIIKPSITDEIYLQHDSAMTVFIPLALFSHIATRLFARPYVAWEQLRRRRMVWEITHAQLRLVLVTIALLFVVFIYFSLEGQVMVTANSEDYLPNIITFMILLMGLFGVLTGITLFIVIIPAAIISYITAQNITRRLEKLIETTNALQNVQTYQRIDVEGEDEIAKLQSDFNRMVERLSTAHNHLEQERDTVRQLLTTRQRLFADVSHELRTPIATVRSYLESMKRSGPNSEDMAIVEQEVLRLQNLVEDVFTFARADIDQLPYDIKTVEIGAVLERAIRTLRKQAWQSRKVDVILDYQPQLPFVMADEKRVEQVLYNLLHNAVRHTPPGGMIRVIAMTEPAHIKIDVQDTGEGIPPDDLPHVWGRFYRAVETRKADQQGAGIGLALVKEMIEAMGGQVSVTSSLGQGSCFSFTLKRAS
jgi:signal transduction histidine kinase